MKQEDLDKLREICEKNGFEVLNESIDDNNKFFVVKKKEVKKIEVLTIAWDFPKQSIYHNNTNMPQFTFQLNKDIDHLNLKEMESLTMFLSTQLENYLNERQ